MNITEETRLESFRKTDRISRQIEILGAFRENGAMTARECKDYLHRHDMNEVKPRITELCAKGLLYKIGTKYDPKTERMVAVYEACLPFMTFKERMEKYVK